MYSPGVGSLQELALSWSWLSAQIDLSLQLVRVACNGLRLKGGGSESTPRSRLPPAIGSLPELIPTTNWLVPELILTGLDFHRVLREHGFAVGFGGIVVAGRWGHAAFGGETAASRRRSRRFAAALPQPRGCAAAASRRFVDSM